MNALLETLGKVGFDWKMALFSFINFLVIYYILKRFFFEKIVSSIDERQNKIKQGVDDYKQAKTELEMAEVNAQKIIDESKKDANKIIEKSNLNIKEQGEIQKQKTVSDIEKLIASAKSNIESQKQDMKDGLLIALK
jgi:F-type H+-transporting ATPase subunit b